MIEKANDETKRRRTERNQRRHQVTARILVMGHERTGKSAAIVRYTTGRFIGSYGPQTEHWLYRHERGFDKTRQASTFIELLEQQDLTSPCASSASSCSELLLPGHAHARELKKRARDQKVDMLNRIEWAHAFLVLYSIDEPRSLEKAAKYLRLLEEIDTRERLARVVGREAPNSKTTTAEKENVDGSKSAQIDCDRAAIARRPILLLANKCDLGPRQRRVGASEGAQLAAAHSALFAELSVSSSRLPLEMALNELFDSIEWNSLVRSTASDTPSAIGNQHNGIQSDPDNIGPEASGRGSPARTCDVFFVDELRALATDSPHAHSGSNAAPSSEQATDSSRPTGNSTNGTQMGAKSLGRTPSSASDRGPAPATTTTSSRYKSLKSSFKRASMAIVTSRVLASKTEAAAPASQVNEGGGSSMWSSLPSCQMDASRQQESTGQTGAASHGLSCEAAATTVNNGKNGAPPSSASQVGAGPPNSSSYYTGLVSDRLKRSIFKYKSRRKTVAFEQAPGPRVESSSSLSPDAGTQSNSSVGAHLDRSTSLISNSDRSYYRSLFAGAGAESGCGRAAAAKAPSPASDHQQHRALAYGGARRPASSSSSSIMSLANNTNNNSILQSASGESSLSQQLSHHSNCSYYSELNDSRCSLRGLDSSDESALFLTHQQQPAASLETNNNHNNPEMKLQQQQITSSAASNNKGVKQQQAKRQSSVRNIVQNTMNSFRRHNQSQVNHNSNHNHSASDDNNHNSIIEEQQANASRQKATADQQLAPQMSCANNNPIPLAVSSTKKPPAPTKKSLYSGLFGAVSSHSNLHSNSNSHPNPKATAAKMSVKSAHFQLARVECLPQKSGHSLEMGFCRPIGRSNENGQAETEAKAKAKIK